MCPVNKNITQIILSINFIKQSKLNNLPLIFLIIFRDTSLTNNISLWGLAVLLLSKTAGINAYSSSDIYDVNSG